MESGLRVVGIPVGQDFGGDHTRSIDTEMEFLPGTLPASSMLDGRPLAFADNGQPCAVDDQMNGIIDCSAMQIDIEILTTTGEGGVIWGFEIDTHQRQN